MSVVSRVVAGKDSCQGSRKTFVLSSFLSVTLYCQGKYGVTKVVGSAGDHGGQNPTVSGSHMMLKDGAE